MLKSPVYLIYLIIASAFCFGDVKISSMFSDNMILQRDSNIPVWGWGNTGDSVTVKIADQKVQTTVQDGKWIAKLESLEASLTPLRMTITVGKDERIINNILIGDVWFCGGQSNMDYHLGLLARDAREPKYQPIAEAIKKEIEDANDPQLRMIKVARNVSSYSEVDNFTGKWVSATNGDTQNFTATGYYFAKELRKHLNIPIGLIHCNYSGTRIEPWIPMESYNQTPELKSFYESYMRSLKRNDQKWTPEQAKVKHEKALAQWKVDSEQAKQKGKPIPRKPKKPIKPSLSKQNLASLFNGMVHPVIPFSIKGFIWYQGESNSHYFPEEYANRKELMINSWRSLWGNSKLPFYYCQLAGFKHPSKDPIEDDEWAFLREQQRIALRIPNTGMAVLHDIGEAKDIHPKNKIDAGKRLSLLALNKTYGKAGVPMGPLFKSATKDGAKITVHFTHTGSGLMTGNKHLLNDVTKTNENPQMFQIKDVNGTWHWANAKILDADSILLWNDKVKSPIEVRYAWHTNPEQANIYNKEGLPASVFKYQFE